MTRLLIPMSLIFIIACNSGPDPTDQVRAARRQYTLDSDFTVSDEKQTLTYELIVTNNAGSNKLEELTIIVEAMDEDKNVIWSDQEELDVSGIGHYATEKFARKKEIEGIDKLAYFSFHLAPDDEDSDYKYYGEFMRVAN